MLQVAVAGPFPYNPFICPVMCCDDLNNQLTQMSGYSEQREKESEKRVQPCHILLIISNIQSIPFHYYPYPYP